MTNSADRVTAVKATSRSDIEAQLEVEEERLQEAARRCGDRGILITRHTQSEFSVELDQGVPYGMTYEKVLW